MRAKETLDYLSIESAKTLDQLLIDRVKRRPDDIGFTYFDQSIQNWFDLSWREIDQKIAQWQYALNLEKLSPGQCVGIMIRNCPEWVIFEHAALRLGLVTVPLYPNDRPDNLSHIINEAEIKILLIEDANQWQALSNASSDFQHGLKVISLNAVPSTRLENMQVQTVEAWLNHAAKQEHVAFPPLSTGDGTQLATIIYTSGTTGKPKGVMLSHKNILSDAAAGVKSIAVFREDVFLSFLPLSHALERTVGCYIPILSGSRIAFSRSIPLLSEDLIIIKPTVLISVPRIFERVYSKIQAQLNEKSPLARKLFNATIDVGWKRFEQQQGRARKSPAQFLWPVLDHLVAKKVRIKLGGKLRFTICGGAPLAGSIARAFIGLGIPIQQGYGLTETSPVISVNKIEDNQPESIGTPLAGIKVRLGADGELQTQSAAVMLGYWKNDEGTRATFTDDGWLKTGDLAVFKGDHIYITGRKKEILVLSNGEKVPPVDIEMAITLDPLFEQALVIGEGKPYLSAIITLNEDQWRSYAVSKNIDADDAGALTDTRILPDILRRVSCCMNTFPGYAQIRKITLSREIWTDTNNMLTASLKIRRKVICARFEKEIDEMYRGH